MSQAQQLPRIHPSMARSIKTEQNPNGPIYTWQTADRHYTLTPTTFTKRELHPHEKHLHPANETVINIPYSKQRLHNEHETLTFIAKNTTIPVPRVVDFSERNGVCSLTVEAIDGEMLDGMNLTSFDQETLMKNMYHFIEHTVLPQLRNLKSATLGQLSGLVLPPPRLRDFDKRPLWASKTNDTECYVFCHCDLTRHNMIVDTKSLRIVGVIDWEYAGYYPSEFEVPHWRICHEERMSRTGLKDFGVLEKRLVNGTVEAEIESKRLVGLIDKTGPF